MVPHASAMKNKLIGASLMSVASFYSLFRLLIFFALGWTSDTPGWQETMRLPMIRSWRIFWPLIPETWGKPRSKLVKHVFPNDLDSSNLGEPVTRESRTKNVHKERAPKRSREVKVDEVVIEAESATKAREEAEVIEKKVSSGSKNVIMSKKKLKRYMMEEKERFISPSLIDEVSPSATSSGLPDPDVSTIENVVAAQLGPSSGLAIGTTLPLMESTFAYLLVHGVYSTSHVPEVGAEVEEVREVEVEVEVKMEADLSQYLITVIPDKSSSISLVLWLLWIVAV
ncbi:hypothetical protein ACFE04_015599 [Oxalis oulophora]